GRDHQEDAQDPDPRGEEEPPPASDKPRQYGPGAEPTPPDDVPGLLHHMLHPWRLNTVLHLLRLNTHRGTPFAGGQETRCSLGNGAGAPSGTLACRRMVPCCRPMA